MPLPGDGRMTSPNDDRRDDPECRLDLRLRQIDVAKVIGCDEMSVANWEKGHTTPRINHMARWSVPRILWHSGCPNTVNARRDPKFSAGLRGCNGLPGKIS